MNIISIVLIGLISTVFAVELKTYNKPIGMLLSLAAGIIILFYSINYIKDILTALTAILKRSHLDTTLFSPIIKATGIAIIVKISSATCRDLGESAIATKIEIAGTAAAITVSLPLLIKVISIVSEII